MRLVPSLVWCPAEAGAPPLDRRLVQLLAGIKKHATLRAAAGEAAISYRAAWGMIGDSSRLLGVTLVELRQGRGARLTDAGEQFLAVHQRASRQLQQDAYVLDLAVREADAPRRSRSPLVLAASHDLLLAAFCEQWAKPEGVVGDVGFRGSIESLTAFARGEADVAGFHAIAPAEQPVAAGVRRLLDPRRDVLIRFAEREQGLIVQPRNPRRLKSLSDVARQQVRFVNRQRGSGTRLLIDRILKQAKIAPMAIRGYQTEEYTHLAVAATVAAGQAEAGFGLKAAADRLGLDFVSLQKETFWLVVRSRRIGSGPVRRLRDGLAGEPLRRAARGLAGYSIRGAGTVVPLSEL